MARSTSSGRRSRPRFRSRTSDQRHPGQERLRPAPAEQSQSTRGDREMSTCEMLGLEANSASDQREQATASAAQMLDRDLRYLLQLPARQPPPAATKRSLPRYCGWLASLGAGRKGTADAASAAQAAAAAPGPPAATLGDRATVELGDTQAVRPARRPGARHVVRDHLRQRPPRRGRPAGRPLHGRSPQEVVHQRGVHHLRPHGRGAGPALPPRRHGPRGGRRIRHLRHLLRLPHRRRGAVRPRHRLAHALDVGTQSALHRPRPDRTRPGEPGVGIHPRR